MLDLGAATDNSNFVRRLKTMGLAVFHTQLLETQAWRIRSCL